MRRKLQNGVKALGLAAGLFVGLSAPAAGAELSVAELTEMERLLARLNFDPGQIDGVVDEWTRTAVRLYQEFAALPADGVPSAVLLAELRQITQALVDLKAAQAEAAIVPPAAPEAPTLAEIAAPLGRAPEAAAETGAGPGARTAKAVTPAEPAPESAPRAVDSPQGGAGIARSGSPAGSKFPATASVDRDGYDEFKKGYAAAQVGNVDLAIKLYTLAIETGDLALEHLADAFYNRANAHQVKGALDYAIADYNAAILNKPDSPGAYYNRAFAFEAKGKWERAVADFKKAHDLGLQRLGVRSATPWETSSLTGDFYFIPNPGQPVASHDTSTDRAEVVFWETIKDSGKPEMFDEYLRTYPTGLFTGLARLKITNLSGNTGATGQHTQDVAVSRQPRQQAGTTKAQPAKVAPEPAAKSPQRRPPGQVAKKTSPTAPIQEKPYKTSDRSADERKHTEIEKIESYIERNKISVISMLSDYNRKYMLSRSLFGYRVRGIYDYKVLELEGNHALVFFVFETRNTSSSGGGDADTINEMVFELRWTNQTLEIVGHRKTTTVPVDPSLFTIGARVD